MKANPFKSRVLGAYGVKRAKELAGKIEDIPYTTLLDYLNQKTEAPYSVLQRFSEETGRSVDYLLTGREKIAPDESSPLASLLNTAQDAMALPESPDVIVLFHWKAGDRAPVQITDPGVLEAARAAIQNAQEQREKT